MLILSDINVNVSRLSKEINVLKTLLTETQTVLNRKNIALFKDKVLDTIHELNYGKLFDEKSTLEKIFLDQFNALSKTNDITSNYINQLLDSKEQVLKQTIELLRLRIEFKLQLAGGKNYTYDPVLTDYLKNDNDFINKIKNLLHRNTDFKYPGLLLGTDSLKLSDNIVSNDPLYVCLPQTESASFELMYNKTYNNHIRKYYFTNNSEVVLATLPKNQFGLIVSTVLIDTIPDAMITNYLNIIKDMLRPGGCFIFTFFGYEHTKSLELVEQVVDFGKTLMYPATRLPALRYFSDYKRIIENLGLNVEIFIPGNTHNLIMIKKDGELKTAKAKKVIGEIIEI